VRLGGEPALAGEEILEAVLAQALEDAHYLLGLRE
jgi:hypothetical protein